MIDIKTFAVPKEGTVNRYYASNDNSSNNAAPVNAFEPHYLWGQYFDDTQDIDGDMKVNGNISADKLTTINLEATNSTIENATIGFLDADYGEIDNLSGINLNYSLATIISAYIKQLSSDEITTETLTVTKSAHFFELVIDKIKAAGGAVLLTPADGFKISLVQDAVGGKKLLFKASDGDRAIKNMWQVNDQAICQTFNQAQVGTNYNVSNKYWWSLVTEVGTETIDDEDYHFIVVSSTTKDGTLNPEAGDEVAMLGYRGTDDPNRQSAIYISAYASLDDELVAPLICQYRGINDFNLSSHKYTWFAAGVTAKGQSNHILANEIRGNLRMSSGQSVEDAISGGHAVDIITYRIMINTTSIKKGAVVKPSTLTATFLVSNNGAVSESSTVPSGLSLKLYGAEGETAVLLNTWNAGSTASTSTSSLTTYDYLYMLLSDGTTAYDRASISIVADGQDGQDGGASVNGGHWEFSYKEAKTKPNRPTGTGNSDGWSTTPSTPDYANGYYLWMSQCFVSGTGNYGTWTDPIRFTGDNGQAGEDGTKIEFIYSVNTSTTTPPTISYNPYNNKTRDDDDFVPSGWTDNPTGVQSQYEVEWVSTREKSNGAWSNFSTPAVWSKWGDKGTDGDGYEYIYKGSNSSTAPLNPNNISQPSSTSQGQTKDDDDFVPNGWSDEPVALSSSVLYEWVSTRKKANGTWGLFSIPKLWAQYSAPGSNGQDGNTWVFIYCNSKTKPTKPNDHVGIGALPAGWSTTWTEPNYNAGEYVWMSQTEVVGNVYGIWSDPIRMTGQNGKAGEDGTKIEFIYKLTTNDTTPATPSTSQTDDYIPTGWTDNPTGVDETNQYEWVSTREKENGIWSNFSTPAIWSKWGEKGMDGDGYEYIYIRLSQGTLPMSPTPQNWQTDASYQADDYVPSGWSDDPVSPSQQYPTVYVSVRKKHDGIWHQFSTPSIWTRWIEGGTGQDGQDGQDGENAKQDLMLDCGSYCTITYNSSTNKYILSRKLSIAVFHYDGNNRVQVTNNTSPSMSDYAIYWKYNTRSGNMQEDDGLYITQDGIWYTDYDENVQYNTLSSMPQYATYQLRTANGQVVLDQLIVYVKMQPEAVFEITANQIQSYVSGVAETINGQIASIQNSISTITQNYNSITATVQGITSTINSMTGDLEQLEEAFTQLSLDLSGFKTTVYKKTEVDGMISETQSMIQQTADQIKLMVNNTGIDIVNNMITLSASNTTINGNLILQQSNNTSQGLIFRNENGEDGLKLTTATIPSLSTFISQYPGYTQMLVGTNGFGWQTGNGSTSYRHFYCTNDTISLNDGSGGGVNNEYHIEMQLRQSGGYTGQIRDYIGQKELGSDANNTCYVKFLSDYTTIQHNGVRIINPAYNYNYSSFLVSSKDRMLLCCPNGNNQNDSQLTRRAVTLKFAPECVGHFYFIKRMYDNGRIYLDGYTYKGTQNQSNTPVQNVYIDDNYLWMVVVVDGLYTTDGYPQMTLILNRIGE